jgi:phosphopantothenoylcysteine decarboxylase/phosphopantothenate--cysteine ligase
MFIALGVSGSIAAYKACEVVRGFDKAGASVQVILTRNATHFITPLTMQALSRRKVLLEQFDLEAEQTIQHVDLTRRISALLVAPATANILAKFAGGIADDFLSTFFVAVTAPVVVAPAMNSRMWLNPATQRNLEILRGRGVRVVEPESGWLAEQETGWGRLAEPDRIVETALSAACRSRQLAGRKIVVSAGPTREAIDPIRFISNRSSGKMGYALAAACAARGAEVVLVSGPVNLSRPHGVRLLGVETALEMRNAITEERIGAEAVFMAAAVSDYVPEAKALSKMKKQGSAVSLRLSETADILAELGRERKEKILVGFAAETESLLENARDKLERKNLDFIVANDVSRPGVGMDADRNEVAIISRAGDVQNVPESSKAEVADAILDRVFGKPPAEVEP